MDFSQIAIYLVAAAVAGVVVKKFKQPVLIGFLFAGFLLAFFGLLQDRGVIENFGQVGVTLLLFLVGLEMNMKELPTVGKAALYTGLGQIGFTFALAFLVGNLLGLGVIPSIYVAIAVCFSSTIIIVKLLSEKKALGALYGKIAVGFLIVQDFAAVIILLFLSGLSVGNIGVFHVLWLFVKAGITFILVWLVSKKFLPWLFHRMVDDSQELMFIVSIAWALGVASLFAGPLGFTFEVGGFMAGLALSNLPEHLEIASRTRPLRDFFITIFFLSLGANLVVGGVSKIIVPALVFSLLVFIGNPIIVMIVMGFLRFKKRTSFLASTAVAQISEFSIIIVVMGQSIGHLTELHLAMVVMIAAITMTASTYLILQAETIYPKIKKYLTVFERKTANEDIYPTKKDAIEGHIILVGCLRTGSTLMKYFKRKEKRYLVVDFNPDVFKKLTAQKVPVIFGDITDPDVYAKLNVAKATLVVSTIDNLKENLYLLNEVKRLERRPTTVFTSITRNDALKLYENGANYVVVPDVVAGEHLRHLFIHHGTGGKLKKIGKSHFNRLIFT